MAWNPDWNMLGLMFSGDIANLTLYTDRNQKKVAFPKDVPQKPPTEKQLALRNRFRLAQQEYMKLTDIQKYDLEQLTIKSSLALTGQNLWISVAMTGNTKTLETLQRQTGITTPIPTKV